jgi:hypothetical protein
VLTLGSTARGYCAENIVVANSVVARISCAGEYASVVERAAKIDQRIVQAISTENVGKPAMSIATSGGHPAICIGKSFLLKVYPEDAAAYKCSPAQLAKQWSDNFTRLFPLAQPAIHMSSPTNASEQARSEAALKRAANVSIAPADWAIVAVIIDHFDLARELDAEDLQQVLSMLCTRVYEDIRQAVWNGAGGVKVPALPHEPGKCPEPGCCPGCRAAMAAIVAPPAEMSASAAVEPEKPQATAMATTPEDEVAVPIGVRRRIEGGIKLMGMVDQDRYLRDRAMVAHTILSATRKELPPAQAGACAQAR